jgi:hypothetical protein
MKNETSGTQSGLSSQEKFDVKKSPRPETNVKEQRPLADKTPISSDRGTFPTK